jgi:hypothetical protein
VEGPRDDRGSRSRSKQRGAGQWMADKRAEAVSPHELLPDRPGIRRKNHAMGR